MGFRKTLSNALYLNTSDLLFLSRYSLHLLLTPVILSQWNDVRQSHFFNVKLIVGFGQKNAFALARTGIEQNRTNRNERDSRQTFWTLSSHGLGVDLFGEVSI